MSALTDLYLANPASFSPAALANFSGEDWLAIVRALQRAGRRTEAERVQRENFYAIQSAKDQEVRREREAEAKAAEKERRLSRQRRERERLSREKVGIESDLAFYADHGCLPPVGAGLGRDVGPPPEVIVRDRKARLQAVQAEITEAEAEIAKIEAEP